MVTLKEKAINYKGKELTDLDKISVNLDVKEGLNEKTGRKFEYVEIEGWKYWIPADLVKQIQAVLMQYPALQYVRIKKLHNGMLYVEPVFDAVKA